ncbi:unnamed protein product [Phytophthora fragariaefolia]|uniref:Unnamed protein product n=1 Tax=Phytophthora fragariaefolia TaxID=1490495 RepID=A0A9W6YK73_9STRA|nr:unnamed protein product [Phytophthora fragariaefolia]
MREWRMPMASVRINHSDLRSNRLTAGPSTRWANTFSSLMDANSPSHDAPSNPDNATGPVDDAPHDSANVSHVHQGGSRSPMRLTFSPSTVRASTVCPEPRIGRVLKTFNIEPFDGSAQPSAIDSGIAAWLRRFEALLGMQEDLHSAQLPDNIKNALLFRHLRCAASQWYIASLHDNRSRSFESLGHALKKEFGSKLSKAQIGQMVAAERKKKNTETYHEYSTRLRAMAAATTFDGFENCDPNNLALSSFIANAWFKHADNLRMVIRQYSNHPLQELDMAITKLCTIAGHQGIITPSSQQSLSITGVPTSVTGKRK